jgi:hypothetical protein
LRLDLDVLSLDVYSNGEVFVAYGRSIREFLDRGGRIVWGIVPTNFEPFEKEDIDSLENRLEGLWTSLAHEGIDREYLLSRSMLSPATCCLVNPDGERTVEKAFRMTQDLSSRLREKNGLSS